MLGKAYEKKDFKIQILKRFTELKKFCIFSSSDFPTNSSTTVTFSKSAPTGVKFETTANELPFSWKEKGGPKRRHDILMELQLNKVILLKFS